MEKIDQNYLIDGYLSGELEGEMMEQFQIQMSLDKNFKKEVILQKEIHDSLTDSKKDKLKESLNNYHSQQAYSQTSILHRIRTEAIAAAIISIMVIGASVAGFFNFGNSNQSIYDSNFSPDINKIVVRSAEQVNESIINKGIDLFNEEDFSAALDCFNKEGDNPKAILFKGICEMELENFENAILNFSKLLDNNNIYTDQAEWHLGLCYLKNNDTEKAINIFNRISKTDGVYQASAVNIINELKE